MTKKTKKPYVIVRSHTAGVHAGYLESRKGDSIILSKSRRLWRWYGASLSQVATTGLAIGDNKIGAEISKTEIISPQGFEIIHCDKAAHKSISEFSVWKI
jgi:hypothetical protein